MRGKPCQMQRQIVTAGLKWQPEVGAQVIMAKAMPRANAKPIAKRLPKAETPRGDAPFKVKVAMAPIPGSTYINTPVASAIHSRSQRGRLCSKSSRRCEMRLGGTTLRGMCFWVASVVPNSTSFHDKLVDCLFTDNDTWTVSTTKERREHTVMGV